MRIRTPGSEAGQNPELDVEPMSSSRRSTTFPGTARAWRARITTRSMRPRSEARWGAGASMFGQWSPERLGKSSRFGAALPADVSKRGSGRFQLSI
jgi:hypothetical protein